MDLGRLVVAFCFGDRLGLEGDVWSIFVGRGIFMCTFQVGDSFGLEGHGFRGHRVSFELGEGIMS